MTTDLVGEWARAEAARAAADTEPPRPADVTPRRWRWMPGDEPGPDDQRSHP